jgi:hypothetical protein
LQTFLGSDVLLPHEDFLCFFTALMIYLTVHDFNLISTGKPR